MAPAVNEDVHVDVTAIEKQLAELWRAEKSDEKAVTKAALWNVVAHTWNAEQHAQATEVLARASASVPQRTIVVQADPERSAPSIASWISANCHLIAGGRQVCSEEVSIVATGEHVDHVPPLVSALLLPDMPVAVWWLGDVPREQHRYAETLLEPADRLIYDSAQFHEMADLDLICRIADETTTAPADLNWARIEEWRAATAALFDPPAMRARLQAIRTVRVYSGGDASFGAHSEALLYIGWLTAQTGQRLKYELLSEGTDEGIIAIEIQFKDYAIAVMRGDRERRVVVANSDGSATALDCVTRSLARGTEDLIVRLLKRPEADRVYLRSLRMARQLGA